ncbi:MAG: zf-TFIIB domain-containing protein [Planctomycetota bacterium]
MCETCGGAWIKGYQYWRWLHAHGANLPERPPAGAAPPVADSPAVKLCPDCGHMLRRARVGHDVQFSIERCGTCGGFWLDRNEWEVLESRNLHDDLHFIFSAAWQHQIADEEARRTHEQRVPTLLGPQDYARARELKDWVQTHPQRPVIMAYLADLAV